MWLLSRTLNPVKLSHRSESILPSLIRDASRYCAELGALNLAQGLPDFPAPEFLKEAARKAIAEDHNQYCDSWGLAPLRVALAEKYGRDNAMTVDPETEVTVCCGATEGLNLALMVLLNPGDEVVVFTPFYENYKPNLATVGAIPRYVALSAPNWEITEAVLDEAFAGTPPKVVIVNNPANPTGKVWTQKELELLGRYCQRYDTWAIADEIYEYILYDTAKHISIASLPGMAERTITVNGFSKTFCVTGWRLGYVIAPAFVSEGIRKVHDFLTICAPAPLQWAALAALEAGHTYYSQLCKLYQDKRAILLPALEQAGFKPIAPQGAYYIWADVSILGAKDSLEAAYLLAHKAGIAAVPGDCFLPDSKGNQSMRFCFAKRDATLIAASQQLAEFALNHAR
jgi:aminotransferase